MRDAGPLPDPDLVVIRRERRALRLARVAGWSAGLVGLAAWALGPCLFVLATPYVYAGWWLMALFAALIGAAAVGMWWWALRLSAQRVGDRGALGRSLGWLAAWSVPAALPGMCWWPFLVWFVVGGSNFWGYEPNAIIGTAIVSLPMVPFAAALWGRTRYRRVYASLPAGSVADPARARRRGTVLAALGTLALLAAWVCPGGPRSAGHNEVVDGRSVDAWAARWMAGDDEALAPLGKAGDAAVAAIRAQWPRPGGPREVVAGWLGENFDLAGYVAPGFRLMRLGVRDDESVLASVARMGPGVAGLAPDLAAIAQASPGLDPKALPECLERLGLGAVPTLMALLDHAGGGGVVLVSVGRVQLDRAPAFPPADIDPLGRRMRTNEPLWVRVRAARAFARLVADGPELRAALDVLRQGLESVDPSVRLSAIAAAGWLGARGQALAEPLRARFDADLVANPAAAAQALAALALAGDDPSELASRIVAASAAPGRELRGSAALALGLLGDGESVAVAAVRSLLSDPDSDVRIDAIIGLAHARGHVRDCLVAIRAEMRSRDSLRSWKTAHVLGGLGSRAADALPEVDAARADQVEAYMSGVIDDVARATRGEPLLQMVAWDEAATDLRWHLLWNCLSR